MTIAMLAKCRRTLRVVVKALFNPNTFIGALAVGIILTWLNPKHNPPSPSVKSQIDNRKEIPIPAQDSSPTPTPKSIEIVLSHTFSYPYEVVWVGVGESHIHQHSGVNIGVNDILISKYVDLSVTFPKQETKEYSYIKVGKVVYYQGKGGGKYMMIVSEIEQNKVQLKFDKVE